MTSAITVPDKTIQAITAKNADLLAQAKALTITTPEEYKRGSELALAISAMRREIVNDFAEAKDAAYKAHRAVCAQEKAHLDKLIEPDRILRGKLTAYDTEQERLREQQEKEARDRARREAEERQLQQAIEAESRGDKRTADYLMKAPVIPEPVEMPVAQQHRVSGVAYVEKWTYEVKDEKAIPREFLTIDHTKLRRHVELMGESARVPGVEVFRVKTARIGGRIAEPKPVESVPAIDEAAENLWG